MSKNDIIACRDVHKSYWLGRNEVKVLHGVSLRAHRGETLSIMGASGTGKSTLLHILGMLDLPDAGTLEIDQTLVLKESANARTRRRAEMIGFVFQQYHLLPELNVVENVLLPRRASPAMTQGKDANDKACQLLEKVGLGHRLKHGPLELSGGEQQRAALARALMNEPQIILADEPTGNLDTQNGEVVLQCIFDMVEEINSTLILVTHNESVARRCDRALFMQDGRIAD